MTIEQQEFEMAKSSSLSGLRTPLKTEWVEDENWGVSWYQHRDGKEEVVERIDFASPELRNQFMREVVRKDNFRRFRARLEPRLGKPSRFGGVSLPIMGIHPNGKLLGDS